MQISCVRCEDQTHIKYGIQCLPCAIINLGRLYFRSNYYECGEEKDGKEEISVCLAAKLETTLCLIVTWKFAHFPASGNGKYEYYEAKPTTLISFCPWMSERMSVCVCL